MIRRLLTLFGKDSLVEDEVRQRKDSVVYGSQAMRQQMGYLAREPGDWDIFDPEPQKAARRVERRFDKASGGDFYFVKRAHHAGTWKVQERGLDNKMGTDDDVQVADYTAPPRGLRSIRLPNGLRVVPLGLIESDKMRSIQDPLYDYRRDKDLEDLKRIKFFKKIR